MDGHCLLKKWGIVPQPPPVTTTAALRYPAVSEACCLRSREQGMARRNTPGHAPAAAPEESTGAYKLLPRTRCQANLKPL